VANARRKSERLTRIIEKKEGQRERKNAIDCQPWAGFPYAFKKKVRREMGTRDGSKCFRFVWRGGKAGVS